MRESKSIRIIYIALVITLLFTMMSSCQGKEEKPQSPEEEKDKIPKPLATLEEKVEDVQKEMEKLMEEIEKPIELQMAEDQKKKEEQGGEEEKAEKEEQGGEDKGQQAEGQGEAEGEGKEQKEQEDTIEQQKKMAEMKKEQSILIMRDGLLKKVEKIHTGWNSYETKAIEDGASEEDIKKFEDALNSLTVAVDEEDDMATLMSLNNITLHMARFYDFYKGNPDGEVLRLRHYTRQIYLDGRAEAWDKAQANVENLESTLDRLEQKIKLSKDKEALMKNLTSSVDDYVGVIEKENIELLKIKMDIVLSNLDKAREEAK